MTFVRQCLSHWLDLDDEGRCSRGCSAQSWLIVRPSDNRIAGCVVGDTVRWEKWIERQFTGGTVKLAERDKHGFTGRLQRGRRGTGEFRGLGHAWRARLKTCRRGHPFEMRPNGHRKCRPCEQARERKRAAERRQARATEAA